MQILSGRTVPLRPVGKNYSTHVFKLLEELDDLPLLLLDLFLVGQAGQGRSHFHHLLTNKGSKYREKKYKKQQIESGSEAGSVPLTN
jgi:hypothetical protein